MTPDYSVEALIENIKIRCSVPESQLTYTPADFTILANNELQDEVAPLLMSTREEYFVDYVDVPSPADGIIPFPEATIGGKVRSVCYLQQTTPLLLVNLPRIDLDVIAGVGFNNYVVLAGFYIQGNNIHLYPSTSVPTNTVIRIYYYKRTLVLAAPTTYGKIISIDEQSNTLLLDFVPFDWAVGTVINTVQSISPFNTTNPRAVITDVSTPSIVVDNVVDMQVGDYVSEYYYSAVPQIPIEAHGYLAQITAAKALEGLGDRDGMNAAMAKAERLKQSLMVMISQRVDGSVKKVLNPNGGLRLRSGLGYWGRNRGF